MCRNELRETPPSSRSWLKQEYYCPKSPLGKLKVVRDKHLLEKNERTMCLLSNSGENLRILNFISERAHKMLQSKAYLHHYEKYGLGQNEIIEYLTILEGVIADYSKI